MRTVQRWQFVLAVILAGELVYLVAHAQMAPSPAVGPQLDQQIEQARVAAIEGMARYHELRAQRLGQLLIEANTKVHELEAKVEALGHCKEEGPPK